MSIHLKCKNCGKILKIDENKFGIRVRCSECHAINRVHGIAMQNQASERQIKQIYVSLNQHRRSLWAFFILLPVCITLSVLASIIGYLWLAFSVGLVFIIGAFLLLDRMSTSSKYLGRSNVVVVFWFLVFFPIFLILCVTSYLRLKTRLSALKETGTRDNDL